MGQKAGIKTTAANKGISEYALRLMIRQGRVPFLRVGGSKGKIILDSELVEDALQREALNNASESVSSTGGAVVNFGQLRRVNP